MASCGEKLSGSGYGDHACHRKEGHLADLRRATTGGTSGFVSDGSDRCRQWFIQGFEGLRWSMDLRFGGFSCGFEVVSSPTAMAVVVEGKMWADGHRHELQARLCAGQCSLRCGRSSHCSFIKSDLVTTCAKLKVLPAIKFDIDDKPHDSTRKDEVTRLLESETSPFTQFVLWVWNGSRYSGLLCMALSSTIYFLMGVLTNIFSVQAIPLFETAFTRCTIILILSYLWLRRSEQPLFGTSHIRIILLLRALTGCISMSSFVYCFQRLPFSHAIVLNSTTPIMAPIMARVFLHEKLKIADIAGLACSFFGVLFFLREMLATQGQLFKVKEAQEARNSYTETGRHIFVILLGLFSSIIGGTSYCLIRAGAKASEQPLLTVFSFGLLASPVMGICTYIFEDFVLPGFPSILLMLVLSILAFYAEVLLARGLQLERMGKVANIQYLQAGLTQFCSLALTRVVTPSFDHLVGFLLIVISVCCTLYIGPDKEMETI